MSLEILKLKVGGSEKWRCLEEGTGQFSLDDKTLEPIVDSADDAVGRLYAQLQSMPNEPVQDCSSFRAEYMDHLANLEGYYRGRCVYDLDGFFTGVEAVTEAETATQLDLTTLEVSTLKLMSSAIRQELSNNEEWRETVNMINPDFQDGIYIKLFPSYDPQSGIICNEKLPHEHVTGLDSGFRYISLLAESADLKIDDNR